MHQDQGDASQSIRVRIWEIVHIRAFSPRDRENQSSQSEVKEASKVIICVTGVFVPETCHRSDTRCCCRADASCIYLESFSFSFLCAIEYTHTVLPNFHIVRICSHTIQQFS